LSSGGGDSVCDSVCDGLVSRLTTDRSDGLWDRLGRGSHRLWDGSGNGDSSD
jgi:hypothetical protein